MPPRSKISQLPAPVREWLHSAFVDRAFGDIEGITAALQDKLREAGIAIYIGKSAVGAESQKVQRAQEALRATTEAARLIAKTASQEGDPLGGATMALVQGEIFELVLKTREASDEVKPEAKIKLLNQVALAAARLSRATVNQDKWRSEVDARARAAADKVTKLAQKGGLQPATVQEIRRSILGIATAEAVATAKAKA